MGETTMNFDQAFETAFARLIHSEGGYTDDPKDPGNWTGGRQGVGQLLGTKYGIAANTYPDVDIKGLTLEKAKAIYHRDWWLRLRADDMDGAIAYQVWDFAVNAGMETAKRALQRAVGVADDGQIGNISVKAIQSMTVTDVIARFNAERLNHYTRLSTWLTFGKGWSNRVAEQLRYMAIDA